MHLNLVVRPSFCSSHLASVGYTLTVPEEHHFLLQRVQPAMVGLIDGSLSTLAPIFSVAIVTAIVVVGFELVGLAWIRWRFFGTSFVRSLGLVSIAGAVIAVVGALVGAGV